MDKKKIAKTAGIALAASLAAGLVVTGPSLAASFSQDQTVATEQVGKKGNGKGSGKGKGQSSVESAHVTQNVTVEVPDDGATYKLIVTQAATAASTSSKGKMKGQSKTIVVPVTGTGSVTISVPDLHPGAYTVDLVKISSSQNLVVSTPATTN